MMHKSNQVGKRGKVLVQEMFSVWCLWLVHTSIDFQRQWNITAQLANFNIYTFIFRKIFKRSENPRMK